MSAPGRPKRESFEHEREGRLPGADGVAYLGDPVSAAGFRLAGARTWTPEAGAESAALARARARAGVVLLSAEVADRLPRDELEAALAALRPLVAIVPDAAGTVSPLDPAERVRAQLGLER